MVVLLQTDAPPPRPAATYCSLGLPPDHATVSTARANPVRLVDYLRAAPV